MKNFTKVCLIICVVLAGLGIIGCVAGIGMGFNYRNFRSMVHDGTFSFGGRWFHNSWMNDNYYDYDDEDIAIGDEDWKKETYTFETNEVNKLDADFEYGEVKIEPSASGKIEVELSYRTIWNNYSRVISCYAEAGELKIEDELESGGWNFMKNYAESAQMTLRIPEDKVFSEFEFNGSAGSIKLDTALKAQTIDLSVDAGEFTYGAGGSVAAAGEASFSVDAGSMKLQNVTAGWLDADCGVGELILEQVQADNSDVNCDIGRVKISMLGAETDYNFSVSCDVGTVRLGSKDYGGFDQHKEIHNNSSKNFNVECGVGQVSVTFQ